MTPQIATEFLEAIPWPLILVGTDARIVAANGPAIELFGPIGVGRHFATQLRYPSISTLIDAAQAEETNGSSRFRRFEGGVEQTIHVQATALNGQVLLAFEDLTPAEHADQIRRDFVANVSHELKTPLTALLGFVETLRGAARDDPAARDRFLSIMEKEANRMNRLIKDLLSLSRVESEARMRPSDVVEIFPLCESAVRLMRPVAMAANVTVNCHPPDPEFSQMTARADADQISQVLINLLENGIKYGRSGGQVDVHIRQDILSRGSGRGAIRIDVSDDGEGFDPLHIPRLTERFYRVDDHRSREKGGTGLGLAIAKHILQRHDGRLLITSEPGKGSVFSMLIPQSNP